ncbi:MAG: hypothetical protein RL095_3310 [Verrucomicrobiota bacterium]|jgi:hypothetical protein
MFTAASLLLMISLSCLWQARRVRRKALLWKFSALFFLGSMMTFAGAFLLRDDEESLISAEEAAAKSMPWGLGREVARRLEGRPGGVLLIVSAYDKQSADGRLDAFIRGLEASRKVEFYVLENGRPLACEEFLELNRRQVAAVVSLCGLPPAATWEDQGFKDDLAEVRKQDAPLLVLAGAAPESARNLVDEGLADLALLARPDLGQDFGVSGAGDDERFQRRWQWIVSKR